MKVLREGHKYELKGFESEQGNQTIQFIEKEPLKSIAIRNPDTGELEQTNTGALITVNDGTTNEEVLEMLINRMNYLNNKFPCRENSIAITHLDTALLWLEKRTRDRIKRDVEGKAIL